MEWSWERRMATQYHLYMYRNSTVLFHFVHTSRMGIIMASPYKSVLTLWKYFFGYCTGATESGVVWKYKITWWAILSGWLHPRAAKSWGSVCSPLHSSHDVLAQTGLGGLGSSSLMLDGNRWVSFLRGFLVHTFYAALNCKNYMHLRFVRNANKHLTTVQVAQSIKAKGQKCPFRSYALKKFEWWKRRPECVFCHFAPLKFLKDWKCKSRKVILRRKGQFQAIKQWGKNMLGLRPDYAMWREMENYCRLIYFRFSLWNA